MDKSHEIEEVTQLLCGAFNEWIEEFFCEDHDPQDNEVIDRGTELMELPGNRSNPLQIMWVGFYGGFCKGLEFTKGIRTEEVE